MATNRAIGMNGSMPWHLPRELQHFKSSTMGRTIVMGRKTWESIGRALPGRQNIVVTRNSDLVAPGCLVTGSLEEAIERAESEEVMVIGGGQLYELALPLAERMILTRVDCSPSADTWFPAWHEAEWQVISHRQEEADEKNEYAYEVMELARRSK